MQKNFPSSHEVLARVWGNSRKPEMSSSASFTAPPPKSNLRRLLKSSHLLKRPKGRFPWKVQFRGAKEQKRQADDKSGICLGLICTQEGRALTVGENKRVIRSRPFEGPRQPWACASSSRSRHGTRVWHHLRNEVKVAITKDLLDEPVYCETDDWRCLKLPLLTLSDALPSYMLAFSGLLPSA